MLFKGFSPVSSCCKLAEELARPSVLASRRFTFDVVSRIFDDGTFVAGAKEASEFDELIWFIYKSR